MEPISLIVGAVAAGAAAALRSTVEAGIKDAYHALKALIREKTSINFDTIEDDPSSSVSQNVLRDELEKANLQEDKEVLQAAFDFLTLVRDLAPDLGQVIGVNLESIRGNHLRITDVRSSGPGVLVRNADLTGDIEITEVEAGSEETKERP